MRIIAITGIGGGSMAHAQLQEERSDNRRQFLDIYDSVCSILK